MTVDTSGRADVISGATTEVFVILLVVLRGAAEPASDGRGADTTIMP